jgi:hypothetical protein
VVSASVITERELPAVDLDRDLPVGTAIADDATQDVAARDPLAPRPK